MYQTKSVRLEAERKLRCGARTPGLGLQLRSPARIHMCFDECEASGLADLSRTPYEEENLPEALAPEILDANDRYEQRLAACKMIVAPEVAILAVTGVLALARKPRDRLPTCVQFLRFAGTRRPDPVVGEAVCESHLSALIHRVGDKLDSHACHRDCPPTTGMSHHLHPAHRADIRSHGPLGFSR